MVGLIAIERYINISLPFKAKWWDERKSLYFLISGWFISLLFSSIYLGVEMSAGTGSALSNGICVIFTYSNSSPKSFYFSVIFTTYLLAAVCFVTIVYIALFIYLVTESKKLSKVLEKKKGGNVQDVGRKVFIIVVTDVLSWIPLAIVNIKNLVGSEVNRKVLATLALVVMPANSAINPLIYTLATSAMIKKLKHKVISLQHYLTFQHKCPNFMKNLLNSKEREISDRALDTNFPLHHLQLENLPKSKKNNV